MSGHASSVVLPHEPVDSSSQQETNRDVTTVHWNVRNEGREVFSCSSVMLFLFVFLNFQPKSKFFGLKQSFYKCR